MNEFFCEIRKILNDANIDEADAKAKILINSKISLIDRISGKEISDKDAEEIKNFAKKMAKTGEPIQYVLGFCEFMGEKFKVSKNVLIPRDETEILVRCALEKIKEMNKDVQVLDIGTGSGIIACMLAKMAQNTEILALDISSDALMVALENVINLNLTKRVVLRKSDITSALRQGEAFDIIVSNPPYVPYNSMPNMDKSVVDFEPKSALFAQNDGLEFYLKIIENAKKYLKKGGYMCFECGLFENGAPQADEIEKIFIKNGFSNVEIVSDMANIKRVIFAKLI